MKIKKNGRHVIKTSLSSAVLLSLLLGGQVFAADNIVVDSGTATGTINTVTDDTTARVVGTGNTVTTSNDAEVFGDDNTVTNSKSQTVIGDKNSVTGRNSGTVSGKQDVRTETVSDLLIGKGNTISGNDTYMKGYESLTVIGNNNTFKAPGGGIVIGDNRMNNDFKDSVIIGSLTPEEKKAANKNIRGMNMTVVGNHAQSGASGTVVGWGAQGLGSFGTVTGFNSVSSLGTTWSSIYGVDNKITGSEYAPVTMVNGAFGTMNKVDYSSNSMVWGTGNWVTNAGGNMIDVVVNGFSDYRYNEFILHGSYNDGYSDHMSEIFRDYASLNGGSVFAMGNSNTSDYARRSSIIGSGNTLNGTENTVSDYNTIAGYQNAGINVNNTSVVGTGNTLNGGNTAVVIGDYNILTGGSNNIILGSMETKDEIKTQIYTPKMDIITRDPYTGTAIPYTMKVKVAVKAHTENISNAVMLGYNTDVQYDGGVALGSNSIASVDKGRYGYNPITGSAFDSDTAIAALSGKESRLTELNNSLGGLESTYTTAKDDYQSKVDNYLEKAATYSEKVQFYNAADAGSADQARYKEQMDAAKTALDEAEIAMNTSETTMNNANKAYTDAVSEKNQITSAWKSNAAAVSVGDSEAGITRQITNVAAGTNDTDAVNVAQLKAAVDAAGTGLQKSNNALSYENNKLSLSIKDSDGKDFITGSVEISDLANSINTRNSVGNFDGDNTITIEKAEGLNEFNGVKYQLKVNTDGKVAADNKGVVNGSTVYNETRVAKDGTYVKQSKSTGENLTALDSQVAANTTQITQNTNNITSISNEVSNITNNVTSLNSQVNKLDNRINRVGAGAAALAALHPQDYDPTAKWDFAAGYGNYKSANAVAIGAFYRPTNDLLFSVGTSMGGGENMFNAGVSIKFGKGSEYSNYSKTDLVSVISSQQAEISAVKADNEAIKADNEAKTKRIEALEKQMQEILSQINR